MKKYLEATPILDFQSTQVQNLVIQRRWSKLLLEEKVKSVYDFVRNEIEFGYNTQDNLKASEILTQGYGQCNTKATLLMALMRAVGVPCRIHGFTIDKALQKGAITGIWYKIAPSNILHSWVEIYVNEKWYFLEGVILDQKYLDALQRKFGGITNLCGYGAYTDDFTKPIVEWNFNHTYIQEKGINQDFGLFDNPDEFYSQHHQKMGWAKRWLYQNIIRHKMNENVSRIRYESF